MFDIIKQDLKALKHTSEGLDAAAQEWKMIRPEQRAQYPTPDLYAYAMWRSAEDGFFPWQKTETLAELGHPFTAQIAYKTGKSPVPCTWEPVGINPHLRNTLTSQYQQINGIDPNTRTPEQKQTLSELKHVFQLEDLAIRHQVKKVAEFLQSHGCNVLQITGIEDISADSRQPVKNRVHCHSSRSEELVKTLFEVTPRLIKHYEPHAQWAVKETPGADQIFTVDPVTKTVGLNPDFQQECELYTQSGLLENCDPDLQTAAHVALETVQEHFLERGRELQCV